MGLKIPVSAPTQRGASSSARRPGGTGNSTVRKPEKIAPCRLRSRRETLTHRSERRATAYPPRGAVITQRWLSDGKHWGVGAPGGTRTPGTGLEDGGPSLFRRGLSGSSLRSSLRNGPWRTGRRRLRPSASATPSHPRYGMSGLVPAGRAPTDASAFTGRTDRTRVRVAITCSPRNGRHPARSARKRRRGLKPQALQGRWFKSRGRLDGRQAGASGFAWRLPTRPSKEGVTPGLSAVHSPHWNSVSVTTASEPEIRHVTTHRGLRAEAGLEPEVPFPDGIRHWGPPSSWRAARPQPAAS